MVSNLGVQPVVNSEAEAQLKFHRLMKRFQAATVGLAVGLFVMALYTSINWKQVAPFEIAFWWMVFALSGLPLTLCVGLDIIFSRGAVIPMRWGNGPKQLVTVTGREAVLTGLGIIAVALAWGGFVLALMAATFTFNWELLRVTMSAFGVLISAVVVLKIFSSLFRDLSRTAAK